MDKYSHWYFRHPAHEQIAQDRYYLKDDKGGLLEKDIDEVFVRVVKFLTGVDPSQPMQVGTASVTSPTANAYFIYEQLKAKRLMPGGRILAQAGTRVNNMNNCFVLDWADSREAIMALEKMHFTIQSQGGGTGIDFSALRPRWAWVAGNQSHSCGSIGFLSMLSWKSALISQGGNRSGANMGKLDDWHPDMLDFIDWKSRHNWKRALNDFASVYDMDSYNIFEWNNPYQWQQFNVSVGVSDKFMKLLKEAPDTEWIFTWPKDGAPWYIWRYKAYDQEFEVTAPNEELAESKVLSQLPFFNKSSDFKLVKGPYNLTVAQLWHRISKNAWEDGCPGILFMDRIRKFHNGEYFNPIVSTNPCGEQPLPAYGVCCLGAVNIYYCLKEDGSLDEKAYEDAIRAGVLLLNYVTDKTKTGIEEIDKNMMNERRIGLGVTGWHDALIKNKLKYSSEAGRKWVAKYLRVLRDTSYRTSIELAIHDGAFPAFNYEGFSKSAFFKTLPVDIRDAIKAHGIRNVTLNTIAPYGTTGTILGTATGCEPHFDGAYKRNSRVGSFYDGSYEYIEWIEKNGPKNIPDYFEFSHDISWEDHLKMQATFAEYIDASVSKTINLPASSTISDIKKAYDLAYDLGIKSTTVYRDGSKTQILETLSSSDKISARPKKIIRHDAPTRPEVLACDIHRTIVKGTPWIVMVGLFDGEPYEVFAGKQKLVEIDDHIIKGEIIKMGTQGGGNKYVLKANGTKMNIKEVFENAEQAAMTRMISTNLRHGTNIAFVVQQLLKSEESIVEFSKAIARVLKKYIKETSYSKIYKKCPSCNSSSIDVIIQEGCPKIICKSCGNTTAKCD